MAAERAHPLIEEAEALGESPEDPLLLFSVLYGFWVGNPVDRGVLVIKDVTSILSADRNNPRRRAGGPARGLRREVGTQHRNR
jgi:hypothetical protein